MSDFDDAPQWYWAAGDGEGDETEDAGDRVVIASGQRLLWRRVKNEVDKNGLAAWHDFGPPDGKATLADCMRVFLQCREIYGANYNRLTIELAQVPAWARFIKEAPSSLGNWISNPITKAPLPRPGYDAAIEEQLGRQIAATLDLDEDWWR